MLIAPLHTEHRAHPLHPMRKKNMRKEMLMLAYEKGFYSASMDDVSTINPYFNEAMRLAFDNGQREGLRQVAKRGVGATPPSKSIIQLARESVTT